MKEIVQLNLTEEEFLFLIATHRIGTSYLATLGSKDKLEAFKKSLSTAARVCAIVSSDDMFTLTVKINKIHLARIKAYTDEF